MSWSCSTSKRSHCALLHIRRIDLGHILALIVTIGLALLITLGLAVRAAMSTGIAPQFDQPIILYV